MFWFTFNVSDTIKKKKERKKEDYTLKKSWTSLFTSHHKFLTLSCKVPFPL